MVSKELNRLKRRMKANDERRRLKQEAFDALKTRVTKARAKDLLPQYQRAVRAKRPPPKPATAEQVAGLEAKIENIKPQSVRTQPPRIEIPEPKVIYERTEPDSVLRERMSELTAINRDMSRAMEQMIEILRNRDAEIEVSVTGRDKKGNIKTLEIKRI